MCVCIPFSLTQSIAFSRSLAAMMCTIYKQEKYVYIYIYMHAYVFGLSVVCMYAYAHKNTTEDARHLNAAACLSSLMTGNDT